jgi:hypothetical protein
VTLLVPLKTHQTSGRSGKAFPEFVLGISTSVKTAQRQLKRSCLTIAWRNTHVEQLRLNKFYTRQGFRPAKQVNQKLIAYLMCYF